MKQLLKPEKLCIDPTCAGAESRWKHWERTFANFLKLIKEITKEGKLQLLCNYASANVFQCISDSENYADAFKVLNSLYVAKRN